VGYSPKEGGALSHIDNRELRRIFRSRRHKSPLGWREMHNGELRDIHSSPSIIRMVSSRNIALMVNDIEDCIVLVGETEGRRPLGGP
jgi:hypothetical protein